MASDLVNRTPQQFIDKHSEDFRNYLNQNDLQVNKLGLVGFLLNVLGNTSYDTKQYYDKLFQESFVATAREDYNILTHSSVWGYIPGFASPSLATGSFFFDFSFMPKRSTNVSRREVTFYNITFEVEGYTFSTNTNYKFVEESGSYYCIVNNFEQGYTRYISSSGPLIEVPFYDVRQATKHEEVIRIQNYDYGTFYPYQVEFDEGFLSDLEVKVRIPANADNYNNQEDWDKFDISYKKHFGNILGKTVFFKRLNAGKFLLEFGSGLQGYYVPNTQALIKTEQTQGSAGNVQVQRNVNFSKTTRVQAVDYIINQDTGAIETKSSYSSENVKGLGYIQFDYSEGGQDLLVGDELRNKVIDHIQSRENLLSRKDFYNIAKDYFDDFEFSFKKFQVIDNNFYLHKTFRDKYFNPIRSSSLMIPKIDVTTTPSLSGSVYFDTSSELNPGIWNFYITASDGFNESNESNEISLTVDSIDNAVSLEWSEVENASSYFIYGKMEDDLYYQYWKVTSSRDILEEGVLYVEDTEINRESNISFFPIFEISGYNFVSPFIYKYNPNMDWHEAYMFFDDFLVYLNDIYSQVSGLPIEKITLPVFFFNIWYDYGKGKTNIDIKSTSDISQFSFELSIDEVNLNNVIPTQVNSNTFRYEFYDSDHGILWKESSVQLDVYREGELKARGSTRSFNQTIDIKDELTLFKYSNDSNDYIIGIPIIDSEKFYSDKSYYMDKIRAFLSDVNFSENRMPTDNITFSLLNTNRISSDKLKYLTKQEYDSFNLVLPLNLEVYTYLNRNIVLENNINLSAEKEELEELIASVLQNRYTGTNLLVYNSQLVDLVHTQKDFIKSVEVKVKDNAGTEIPNGIETYELDSVISRINNDESLTETEKKVKILEYTPPYFYWNLDNIIIKTFFD